MNALEAQHELLEGLPLAMNTEVRHRGDSLVHDENRRSWVESLDHRGVPRRVREGRGSIDDDDIRPPHLDGRKEVAGTTARRDEETAPQEEKLGHPQEAPVGRRHEHMQAMDRRDLPRMQLPV